MTDLKYYYMFHNMEFGESVVILDLYKKCGGNDDIFTCETSIRELEESINTRFKREKHENIKFKKDKINKILSDLENKEYITFIQKAKGRQKSIIRINIKDIINGKYEFKSMANKSKYKSYYK